MTLKTVSDSLNNTIHWREYLEEFKFYEYLEFDFSHIKGDLLGGLTSAVIALPLALGFGLLSTDGDPHGAVAGLYGAIFTGILASLFGGTPQQITGPTGGMTVILTEVYLQTHDINALLASCFVAGLLQIMLGFLKIGRFVAFVPQPVISGFTNGIAILIFLQQFKVFAAAPLITLVTIASIYGISFLNKSLPKLFIGLIIGSLVAHSFSWWSGFSLAFDPHNFSLLSAAPMKLVGTIPNYLQAPALPITSWHTISKIIPAAFTIAALGALETLLASVVVDSATNTDHNSNRELIGQGIGNSVAALFGGIAGTGAIVRTMINLRTGGKTRLSGIICGLVVLVVMLFMAHFAAQIPVAALAGVLMTAALGMFEWEPLKLIRKTPLEETMVFLATMFVTVFADLITAVFIGLILASFMFINRMSKLGILPHAERVITSIPEDKRIQMTKNKIAVVNLEGALFFGAVKNFTRAILADVEPEILILNMTGVTVLDTTGAQAIENLVQRLRVRNRRVLICGMRRELRKLMHGLGFMHKLGIDTFPETLSKAVDFALAISEERQPKLIDYMKTDLMFLDVHASTKKELFEFATHQAAQAGYVFDEQAFIDNLWAREQDSPTSLGHGIAIPHSRSGNATQEIVIIFLQVKDPIPDYEPIDGEPISTVLMISAGDDINGYLQVLRMIALTLGEEEHRKALRAARTVEEVQLVFS